MVFHVISNHLSLISVKTDLRLTVSCNQSISKCVLAQSAMTVGRLYLNLFSSNITWIWLPRISFILLISEGSKKEDGNYEEDEEDERLQCLQFFPQDYAF